MAKDQNIICTPKMTEEQRLNRICSILSIGIMRHIKTEKATGLANHYGTAADILSDNGQ